jgi:hypothetical protein
MWPTATTGAVCTTASFSSGRIFILKCRDAGIAFEATREISASWINLTGRDSNLFTLDGFVDLVRHWQFTDPTPHRDLLVIQDPGSTLSLPNVMSLWAVLNSLRDRIHLFLVAADASLVIMITQTLLEAIGTRGSTRDLLSVAEIDTVDEAFPGSEGVDDPSGEPYRELVKRLEDRYQISTARFVEVVSAGDIDGIDEEDAKRWLDAAVFLRREE